MSRTLAIDEPDGHSGLELSCRLIAALHEVRLAYRRVPESGRPCVCETSFASASAFFRAASSIGPIMRTVISGVMPSFFASVGGGLSECIDPFRSHRTAELKTDRVAVKTEMRGRSPSALSLFIFANGTLRRISPRRISSGGSSSAFTWCRSRRSTRMRRSLHVPCESPMRGLTLPAPPAPRSRCQAGGLRLQRVRCDCAAC